MSKPKLLETDFPLREVSEESVREKNIRHGHISTRFCPIILARVVALCLLLCYSIKSVGKLLDALVLPLFGRLKKPILVEGKWN